MLNKKIALALAAVVAVLCLVEAREEGPHDMAEALRMLQELDRYYTQAARPRLMIDAGIMEEKEEEDKIEYPSSIARIDRRDNNVEANRLDPELLDRAVRLFKLQTLDRIYSYHTRPRFGKRADASTDWAKELTKSDVPAWWGYARRR